MALTLGMTGMDAATEAALKAAFNDANARLGNTWRLEPESQARYVVVDMDSMYGPMSWLRLHAADKTVIGLTSSTRTQADFHLPQPVDADSVTRLLQQIAPAPSAADSPSPAAAGVAAPSAPTTAAAAPIAPAEPAPIPPAPVPAGLTPAPVPQDQLPEEQPSHIDEEAAPPDGVTSHPAVDEFTDTHEPASAAVAQVVPAAPSLQPHAPPTTPAPEANERTLGDWLSSGQVRGRLKLERDGVAILIDTEQRQYLGTSALKPLAGHVSALLPVEDLVAVDADWDTLARLAGEPQPLSRLLWLGGLLAGQGALLPGFDPEGRYQLLKWPQTEREYPKHFRIATAMMKGPATLAEIAEASGVPVSDVCDFVNANLATGFADIERLPDPEPEPTRSAGLFGRLRGR